MTPSSRTRAGSRGSAHSLGLRPRVRPCPAGDQPRRRQIGCLESPDPRAMLRDPTGRPASARDSEGPDRLTCPPIRPDSCRPPRPAPRPMRSRHYPPSSPWSFRASSKLPSPPWRSRPNGRTSSGCGATRFHPMCSYLASFPAALTHAFIARYSRPGDVVLDPFSGRGTTPLQACAEGRIGVGNDLNPFAHLLTAAKVEPATRGRGADAPDRAPAALGRRGRRLVPARPNGPRLDRARRSARAGRGSGAGPAGRPGGGPGAGRGRPALPSHGPSPSCSSCARPFASTTASTASSPRRSRASSTARARSTCRSSCPTRSAWRRATFATSRPGRSSARPSATSSTASRPSSAGCTVSRCRRFGGSPCWATRATPAPRARAALRERGLPDRARLVVTSPPYLRVVKYGYYNWLRTWFLGFDAARHRRRARRCPPPRRRTSRSCGDVLARAATGPRPTTPSSSSSSAMSRPTGDGASRAASAWPSAVWESAAAPEGYRLAGIALDDVHADRKMTKLWGDEAGPGDQDRPDPRARGDRGRAADAPWPARPLPRRLDLAAPPPARPSRMPAMQQMYHPLGPGGDGPAGPHEEPRPRPDDQPPAAATSSSSRSTCTLPRRTSSATRSTATSRQSARSRARWPAGASAPDPGRPDRRPRGRGPG